MIALKLVGLIVASVLLLACVVTTAQVIGFSRFHQAQRTGVWGIVYVHYRNSKFGWAWAKVTFTNEQGTYNFHSTTGGLYWGWLPEGTYQVVAKLGPYEGTPKTVTVSRGTNNIDLDIEI